MGQHLNLLLIGNYPPDRQESMLRFGELLHQELKAHNYKVQYLSPRPRLNRMGAPPAGFAKWVGYIDKFLVFPLLLKRTARRFDVVHIVDHSNSMYITMLRHKPHLITCHDVLAIQSAMGEKSQNATGWTGKVFQNLILRGLNKAQHIACVSYKSRDELLKLVSLTDEAISVVHNGLNYPYTPMDASVACSLITKLTVDAGFHGEVPPFILHVGANHWYKNRLGVLKIYARLLQNHPVEEKLILIMVGEPFTTEMRHFVEEQKLGRRVVELSGVSSEDLRALYSTAQLLLFPSLAEGFGWPIIEAQACGCPVVTTNQAPMTEIGSDAAVYIDVTDTDSAAEKVAMVLNETGEGRQERRSVSLANASHYSTALMAERYIALYEELVVNWKTTGKGCD